MNFKYNNCKIKQGIKKIIKKIIIMWFSDILITGHFRAFLDLLITFSNLDEQCLLYSLSYQDYSRLVVNLRNIYGTR